MTNGSLMSQPISTRREGSGELSIQLLSRRTGYWAPIRGQYSGMWYVAASNTRLTTKCKMNNHVYCHGGSAENCSLKWQAA